jgi:putative ATPase
MLISLFQSKKNVSEQEMVSAIQKNTLLYDRKDEHYNTISALHKSLRGSDDNAALYWLGTFSSPPQILIYKLLGRMLYSGDDPLYVARRLIRFASEDIGIADNNALNIALDAYKGVQVVGMPECDVILAQCVTVRFYLCT